MAKFKRPEHLVPTEERRFDLPIGQPVYLDVALTLRVTRTDEGHFRIDSIDRASFGDTSEPTLELAGEALGEVLGLLPEIATVLIKELDLQEQEA